MNRQKFVITLTLISMTAWGYQKPPESFTISNPLEAAKAIGRDKGLAFSNEEINDKRDLIRMRLFNPKQFFALKHDTLNNSPQVQSYINEVDEAFWGFNKKISPKQKLDYYNDLMKNKPIDIAKKIAKQQLLIHIQKNWPQLKNTILNDNDVESWENGGRTAILDRLDKDLIYVPQNSKDYQFRFGDSFVEIDKKTLKHATVGLDINSRLDSNKLVPEAEDIVPDDG